MNDTNILRDFPIQAHYTVKNGEAVMVRDHPDTILCDVPVSALWEVLERPYKRFEEEEFEKWKASLEASLDDGSIKEWVKEWFNEAGRAGTHI